STTGDVVPVTVSTSGAAVSVNAPTSGDATSAVAAVTGVTVLVTSSTTGAAVRATSSRTGTATSSTTGTATPLRAGAATPSRTGAATSSVTGATTSSTTGATTSSTTGAVASPRTGAVTWLVSEVTGANTRSTDSAAVRRSVFVAAPSSVRGCWALPAFVVSVRFGSSAPFMRFVVRSALPSAVVPGSVVACGEFPVKAPRVDFSVELTVPPAVARCWVALDPSLSLDPWVSAAPRAPVRPTLSVPTLFFVAAPFSATGTSDRVVLSSVDCRSSDEPPWDARFSLEDWD